MNWTVLTKIAISLGVAGFCMVLFRYLIEAGMTRTGSALSALGLLLVIATTAYFVEFRGQE